MLVRHESVSAGPKPHVLQVVLTLGAGGTERLVLEICKRLRPRVRFTVCTLDEPGLWASELDECGIDVVPLRRRPGFRPELGYRIAQVAKRTSSTVVHCHHYSPYVYGRVATMMRPRMRLVFTEHGRLSDGPPSTKRRFINPVLARFPGSLFAVSRALRASMIHEGFPPGRVGVVHNGVDPGARTTAEERRSVRAELALGESDFVLGTIARLDPVKDLETLIDAFALLVRRHAGAALVIVGDGAERMRLEQHAAERGVRAHVHFAGQRNDARRLLCGLDAFVNSSISEGVSLTILEAMAAELPVVATRVGGTPEVVIDEQTGVLVPARNPAALEDALHRLANSAELRRRMGSAGRQRVLDHFTLDRMVEHYAQVYRELDGRTAW